MFTDIGVERNLLLRFSSISIFILILAQLIIIYVILSLENIKVFVIIKHINLTKLTAIIY
ncbi:MAG: hypothetical protein Tsb0014_18410 [Pleurocapsa sp.]